MIWLLNNISEACYPVKQLRYVGRFLGFFMGAFKGALIAVIAIYLMAFASPFLAGEGGDKAAFFNSMYDGGLFQKAILEDNAGITEIDDFFDDIFGDYRPFGT